MKRINPTIEIGDPDDIALRQKVWLEDEVIIDRQADSLLGTMAMGLYGMFAYNDFPNDPDFEDDRKQLVFEPRTDGPKGVPRIQSGGPVSADTSVVPAEISTDGGNDFRDANNVDIDWQTPGSMTSELGGFGNGTVMAIETEAEELSGIFFVPHDDNTNTITLYKIDSYSRGFRPNSVTPLDLTGASVQSINTMAIITVQTDNSNGIEKHGIPQFADDQLKGSRLQLGNDATPNDIRRPIGTPSNHRFSTAGNSLSKPANSPNSSSILLSRDFTNNNAQDFTVNEVWWSTGILNDFQKSENVQTICLARDVTQVTVPGNSTITVQYKIECSNNGGGLMQQFMGLLYRHLSNTDFEVSRVGGTSVNRRPGKDFYSVIAGGHGLHPNEELRDEELGPQVGTDATPTDNSLESLVSEIDHGRQSGELAYFGSLVRPIRKDEANDKYAFDVQRLFKNESGGPVDIEETGLYVGGGSDRAFPEDAHMIARHTPGTVTVADGELIELTYTFEVALP